MFWNPYVAIGRRDNLRLPAITRPLVLHQINGQYERVSVFTHLCNDAFANRNGLAHPIYSSLSSEMAMKNAICSIDRKSAHRHPAFRCPLPIIPLAAEKLAP